MITILLLFSLLISLYIIYLAFYQKFMLYIKQQTIKTKETILSCISKNQDKKKEIKEKETRLYKQINQSERYIKTLKIQRELQINDTINQKNEKLLLNIIQMSRQHIINKNNLVEEIVMQHANTILKNILIKQKQRDYIRRQYTENSIKKLKSIL